LVISYRNKLCNKLCDIAGKVCTLSLVHNEPKINLLFVAKDGTCKPIAEISKDGTCKPIETSEDR
jgi:hypothetical protein